MQKKFEIIPRIMWMPLILTLTLNSITYFGSRQFTSNRYHFDLSNPLDDGIPFVPWTVVIYLGCYVFWVINYVIGCRQERDRAFRFISADFAAKLVCLFCYMAFPTTNTRPVIEGSSVWEELMRLLYRMDAADNLLPSIHCLTSWFCFLAVRKNEKIPVWYKWVSLLIAVSICISTLTTKQHVLIDVFAGVALAELSYLFVEKSGFSRWYKNVMEKGEKWMADRRRWMHGEKY